MGHVPVDQVLEMIDRLPNDERELLDQRLAERTEAAWRKEAEIARRQAQTRGIDQTAIDEAIRTRR